MISSEATIEDYGIAIHELDTSPTVNAHPDPLGGLERYPHDH